MARSYSFNMRSPSASNPRPPAARVSARNKAHTATRHTTKKSPHIHTAPTTTAHIVSLCDTRIRKNPTHKTTLRTRTNWSCSSNSCSAHSRSLRRVVLQHARCLSLHITRMNQTHTDIQVLKQTRNGGHIHPHVSADTRTPTHSSRASGRAQHSAPVVTCRALA